MSRRIQSPAALFVAILVIACAIAAFAAVPQNLPKALEEQRRLVVERPQDPGVFNDLGSLLLLAGRVDEAEQAYRKALEIDPRKASALFNLAQLQQQRGELREALKLYQRVIENQPGHAWAHYQIGTLYEGWNQEGKAVEHYARAFALDPQLAFKEVNPHIVENGLVTKAMLRAYNEGPQKVQVPRVFDERDRIVDLLVPQPQPKADAQAEETAEQPSPGQTGQESKGQPGASSTVIRQGDLDNRATGQATPQARGGRTTRPSPSQRGLRQWNRPEPLLPTGEEPVLEPGVTPEEVVTPPPGGVYYRPGAQSSGRMSLRVVPEDGRGGR